MEKNCLNCMWWKPETGCNNTNWKSGKVTDANDPVCGTLTPTSGKPTSWKPVA